MIEASHLRIGNAIWDETQQKVKWVNHRVINDLASHNNPLPYSYIPITEEWLLKFGFVKVGYGYQFGNDFGCAIINDEFVFYWRSNRIRSVKYVHQLQNLYFACEDLEIIG